MKIAGNAFRITPDGSLDKEYLRICAIYRRMSNGRITAARARELSRRPIRGCCKKSDGWRDNAISIWARNIDKRAA